jgi:NADH-quinone oxidoreductase subunit K
MLFTVGLFGILYNRRNLILILMSIEVLLLGVNVSFISFAAMHDDVAGQIFALLVLTVAAAEAAIALAILVIYFRNKNTIDIDQISSLKG